MTIGQKIDAGLRRKRKTKAWLAAELGIARQSVTQWVGDKTSPSRGYMARVSELLGIPIHELLPAPAPGPAPPPSDNAEVARLLSAFERTPAHVRGIYIALMDAYNGDLGPGPIRIDVADSGAIERDRAVTGQRARRSGRGGYKKSNS